jgi:phosphate transport system substrate-binding protein
LRTAISCIAGLALAACGGAAKLSDIPEQNDAPPVFLIGEAEKIRIVGSSTVAPFSTTAAEQFGAISPHPAPIVETTGTGGGFKAFCRAIGPAEPSIVNASRKMKAGERALCAEAGIVDPVEIKIGYDGIVLANRKSGPVLNLTKAQIFGALAANLPDGEGGWIENPHRLWSDVDPSLPEIRILVSGPPPTSGTRDAFVEIAMEGGARAYESLLALEQSDPEAFRTRAHQIRNDGAWIDSGENDSTIINTLLRNDDSVGVLGYSFLEQNLDRIKAASVGDTQPTFQTIISGDYEVSRSMYFYVKREHLPLVPGLAAFVREFTQEDAWGPDGYLADKGLIPLMPEERERVRTIALAALTDPKNPPRSEDVPSPPQIAETPPG